MRHTVFVLLLAAACGDDGGGTPTDAAAGADAVMRARLDLAVSKHCDGVEPDNVDGSVNAPMRRA